MKTSGLTFCLLPILLLSCSPGADESTSESRDSSEPFRYRSLEEIELEREESLRTERLNASPAIRGWAEDYVESFTSASPMIFLADMYLAGIDLDGDGDSDTLAYLDIASKGPEDGGHVAIFVLEADSLRFDAVVNLDGTELLRFDSIVSMRKNTIIVAVTNRIDSSAGSHEIRLVWKPGRLREVVEPVSEILGFEREYPMFIPGAKVATFDRDELMSNVTYPEEARRSGIEGSVLLDVFLSERGAVDSVQLAVVRPNEHELRDLFFDHAVEAVRKTRFTPVMVDGAGVKSHVLVDVRFSP